MRSCFYYILYFVKVQGAVILKFSSENLRLKKWGNSFVHGRVSASFRDNGYVFLNSIDSVI